MPDGWEEMLEYEAPAFAPALWDHLREYRDLKRTMETAIKWRTSMLGYDMEGVEEAQNILLKHIDSYIHQWRAS